MKIGACTVIDDILVFKGVADYVELRLNQIADLSDEQFEDLKKLLKDNEIEVGPTNYFLPGNVKICGPEMNIDTVREYSDGAIKRAAELGIDICVLGSGGGRRIPDDMDFDEGMKQLYEALQVIGDCGAKYGVTIVLEPLNRMEANTITTLAEGAQIVRKLNHPNIKLLADVYHMEKENEDLNLIVENKDIILHTHIANPYDDRACPVEGDGYDYEAVKKIFADAGYDVRLSVEGKAKENITKETFEGVKFLKKIF